MSFDFCGQFHQASRQKSETSVHSFASLNFRMLVTFLLFASCQKPTNTALTGDDYPHPGSTSTGGVITTQPAVIKSSAKAVSLTEDTVLTLSNTTVTIPAGAVSESAVASLSSYGGTFINTPSITLQSEPVLLVIAGADGNDLPRGKLHKDILVDVVSGKRASPTKLALLFHENGGLSDATKTGMSQTVIAPMLTAAQGSTYKASYKIRPSRIAMVLAQTDGSLPPGYEDFKLPSIEVTDLSGVANSPADVTLSWKSDSTRNQGFALVYEKAASVSAVCSTDNLIEPDYDATTEVYSYAVGGLDDESEYTFKVCTSSFRDPVDLSAGATVSVTTPKRALAALTNTPSDPTNATALNITVGGENVTFYRYALLSGVTDCSTASYSAWLAVSAPITDTLTGDGARLLCVLGRIDITNDQIIPTIHAFTVDQTPPVFTSVDLINDISSSSQSAINLAEKNNSTDITGNLVASGYDAAAYSVTQASSCDGTLVYKSDVPTNAELLSGPEASDWRVCVKVSDDAGNAVFGSSAVFTVDWTPPVFSSLPYANATVSNGYINNNEQTTSNLAVAGPISGSGYDTAEYAVVASTVDCNGAVSYGMTTIPNATNAAFLADGAYKVCVRLRDQVMNESFGGSSTITVKKTLATFTSLDRGDDVSDGFLSIADRALTTPLAKNLVASNYDTAEYALALGTANCSSQSSYGAMPRNNSTGMTNNSQYKVCVRLGDIAGNPYQYGSTVNNSFRALISLPTCTSVVRQGLAADGYISSTDRAAATAIAVANASGFTSPSSSVSASLSQFTVIDNAVTCNQTQSFSSVIPTSGHAAFSVNGTYKICARVQDAIAQYGYCSSAAIIANGNTITFTSIDRVGPASDGYINASEHTSTAAIVGNLVGSNYNSAGYSLVSAATNCDSSLSYSGTVPQANDLAIAVDGETYKVCVELSDLAGNPKAYGSSATFTYDATAPSFVEVPFINSATDNYLNASEHALATDILGAVSATGQILEEFSLVDQSTTCGAPLIWSSASPKANDAGFTTDGAYKFCVQLSDAAGNMSYGESAVINFDGTAPVFTSISLANDAMDTIINVADTSSHLEVVGSLVGSGYTTEKYLSTLSTNSCSSQVGYSVAVPKASDFASLNGSYQVCVELTDLAGNQTYGASASVTVDTTLPVFTSLALGLATANGYLSAAEHLTNSNVAGTLTATGYDTAEYALVTATTDCDGLLTYGAMPQVNSAIINTHEQAYKVCVKLSDTAGNPMAYGASASFTALLTSPGCSDVELLNGALDGYINSTEHASSLPATSGVNSPSSTVATTQYAVITSTATCNSSQIFSGTVPKTSDAVFGVNGTYKICAKVADLEAQAGYCSSSNITVVNNTITFSSIDLSGPASDGFINSAEHALSSVIVANLVASNYDSVGYAVVTAASTCNGSLSYSGAVPTADQSEISSDGTNYKVCVELSDNAGNTKAYGGSSSFVYDATAPVFTSLLLLNAASDGYINSNEHALNTSLAGPLVASGQTVERYALVSSSTTCALPLSWVTGIPKANDPLFSSEGSYKICVQLTDAAGNATYDSSTSLEFDSVAPSFTSLSLVNSALDTYINAAETSGSADVVGGLVASGQSAESYQLAASTAVCSALSSYGSSIPKESDFFGLNGDYKTCIKLTDNAGNESFGASNTIHVDTVVPSFTSVALTSDATDGYINNSESASNNPLVTTAVGSGHDATWYVLVENSTSCSSATGWSSSIPKSSDPVFTSVGSYKVCVKLSDQAGNPDVFGASSAIAFDNVAPGFTSLTLAGDASDGYLNQTERSNATSIIGILTASSYTSATYKLVSSATGCDGALTYGLSVNSNSSDIGVDGNYKICVKLLDAAGNEAFGASSTLTVDVNSPTFTSLALGAAVADGYLSLAERTAATSLGGALTSSGGSTYAYAVVTAASTCNAAVSYAGMPNSDDASLLTAQTYKLCARILDDSGNASYGSSSNFTTDFVPPAITGVTLAAVVLDGYLNLSDQAAGSALLSGVTAANHDTLSYAVVTAATTCNSGVTYGSSLPTTASASFSADGSWKVCVKASDNAGNTDAYSGSASFTRDVTRPTSAVSTSGAITINSTAGTSTILSGSASDATAGLTSVVISIQEGAGSCFDPAQHDFSEACPNWLSATSLSSWSYTLDDSDLIKGQTYTVSSKATDQAGNEQTSFGSSTFSFTAVEASNLWNRDIAYDQSSDDDRALAGAIDSNGNLYVVGYHTATDKNWLLKKYSRRGIEDTTNWNKDVGDSGVDEVANSVAVDTSNNVYVVGSRWNGFDWDWMIKKYSALGVEDSSNWDMLINSGNGNDEALGVTTDSSGNVYVVGYGRNVAGVASGEDVWMKKFQSDGTLVCEQKLDEGLANLSDRATAVAVNNTSSKVYIAGYKTATGPDQRLFVKRLRMSDCTIEVSATGNSVGNSDRAAAIRIDSTGAVYVAGVYSTPDSDWWIQKYTASLALSSEINNNVNRSHVAQALAIDSSNRIYVGGYKSTSNGANPQDAWLRQFNSSLAENSTWDQPSDGAGANDQVTALVVTSGSLDADNVYMIGWSTNLVGASSGADWWIKKLAGP